MTLATLIRREVRAQRLLWTEVADAARLTRSGLRAIAGGRSLGCDESLRRLAVALGLEQQVLLLSRAEDAAQSAQRIQTRGRAGEERLEPRRAQPRAARAHRWRQARCAS
jgi:hypothetical protein